MSSYHIDANSLPLFDLTAEMSSVGAWPDDAELPTRPPSPLLPMYTSDASGSDVDGVFRMSPPPSPRTHTRPSRSTRAKPMSRRSAEFKARNAAAARARRVRIKAERAALEEKVAYLEGVVSEQARAITALRQALAVTAE